MGVSSWAFKDIPESGAYPITAQRGTAAEKRAQASLLTRLVQLIPHVRTKLKATQGRYNRDHDKRLALPAEKLAVGGCGCLRDHAKERGAGGKLAFVARGPYRVVFTDGPTVLLHVDGEHLLGNIAHVVRASGTAAESPVQHPSLRAARSFHGAQADGQQYAVDRIADHATLPDGTLVQVYWTGYPQRTHRGRPARDAARLPAPRRALGAAPHVRRPAAGSPARRGSRRRRRLGRRRRAAPGHPCLTPRVCAVDGRGESGRGVL